MNDKPSQDNHKRSKKFHQQFGIICHTYYITYVIEVVGVGCVLPGWVMIVVL